MQDYIHIKKINKDDKTLVCTEMQGDLLVLSSIVFSCMKTNADFASIILEAVRAYENSSPLPISLN
jgi:hypothetical protein